MNLIQLNKFLQNMIDDDIIEIDGGGYQIRKE
jgi:hypothetical protein